MHPLLYTLSHQPFLLLSKQTSQLSSQIIYFQRLFHFSRLFLDMAQEKREHKIKKKVRGLDNLQTKCSSSMDGNSSLVKKKSMTLFNHILLIFHTNSFCRWKSVTQRSNFAPSHKKLMSNTEMKQLSIFFFHLLNSRLSEQILNSSITVPMAILH